MHCRRILTRAAGTLILPLSLFPPLSSFPLLSTPMQHENVTSYGATSPHSRGSTVYSVTYSPDLTSVPLDRDVDAFPALLRARLAGNTTPHATPNDSIPDFMSDASITPTATTPLVRSKAVKYSSSDDGSSYFPSPENNNLILAGEESGPVTPTPLPVRQLAALLIGQLPEPGQS